MLANARKDHSIPLNYDQKANITFLIEVIAQENNDSTFAIGVLNFYGMSPLHLSSSQDLL